MPVGVCWREECPGVLPCHSLVAVMLPRTQDGLHDGALPLVKRGVEEHDVLRMELKSKPGGAVARPHPSA
jgi:hypothetical protein